MAPAIPLFIRLCDNVQRTGKLQAINLHCFLGTYKLIKTDLQRLAIDKNDDPLYIFDQVKRSYTLLTDDIREQLSQGTLGL